MIPKIFPDDNRPISQFFQLLIYMVVGFGLMSLLAVLLGILIWDIDLTNQNLTISEELTRTQVAFFKLLQLSNSIGLFVIPPFLANKLSRAGHFNLVLSPFPTPTMLLASGAVMLFLLPLVNVMVAWNEHLSLPDSLNSIENWMRESEARAKVITTIFLKMNGPTDLLVNLVLIALVPAVGEELLFRGGLQGIFSRLFSNAHLGIWMAAFVFSAFHMQFFGFFPRLVLGVVFGYLLYYSGSIWLPIVAHFLNNALAVVVHYFIQKGVVDESIEELGVHEPYYFSALIGLVLACGLFYQFVFAKRQSIKKEA